MPARLKLQVGQKFNRLSVLEFAGIKNQRPAWLCLCECGKVIIVRGGDLTFGKVKSCGCLTVETRKVNNYKHGLYKSPLKTAWSAMKQRCYNSQSNAYPDYGARGITVCGEWRQDFKAFHYWAVENGWAPELSLDRIDINGNYEPGNCRWATDKEQARNKRNSVNYVYGGMVYHVMDLVEKYGNVGLSTFTGRMQSGWDFEKALLEPPNPRYQRFNK